ncbi:MAG: DinB family protein, partial [Terriglobia bacterium]
MDLKEFFLKQKQATYDGAVKVFAKIPSRQLAWKPAPDVLSLGEIVRHVWTSEEGARRMALNGDWSYFEKRVTLGLRAV